MRWLPLVFAFSFGFGQLFKWSQRRGCVAPVVVSTNYLVIAAILAAVFGLRGALVLSPPILLVGGATGTAFFLSMLALTHALSVAPVAATLTSFRLALLVPVTLSTAVWGESVSAPQLGGIAMAVASLVLMTWTPGAPSGRGRSRHAALIVLVFILQGGSLTCLRWVHYAGLDAQRHLVLLVVSLTAGVLTAGFAAVRQLRPRPQDLGMGAGIGVFNMTGLLLVLTVLSQVQGTVFFPLQGCAVVIMDNVFAHFVWRERLGRRGMAGAAVGAVAMLLLL